jgi:ribosomal-protein-serine acetyltransferase
MTGSRSATLGDCLVMNCDARPSIGTAARTGRKSFALGTARRDDRPMESPAELLRHDSVELRRWRASDADLCFRLVSESLEHLRPWMPWATPNYGMADAVDYLERCEADWATGTAFQYLIIADGEPAGSAGLMARIEPGGLEIGYWVHPDCTARGIATAGAAALTEAAFTLPGIDHVEIHHDELNLASGRVPAKLGYKVIETRRGRFEPAPGDSGIIQIWRMTPADRYEL